MRFNHTQKGLNYPGCGFLCPHQELNLDLRFRKPPFYPLNYEDLCKLKMYFSTARLNLDLWYYGFMSEDGEQQSALSSFSIEERGEIANNLREIGADDDQIAESFAQTIAGMSRGETKPVSRNDDLDLAQRTDGIKQLLLERVLEKQAGRIPTGPLVREPKDQEIIVPDVDTNYGENEWKAIKSVTDPKGSVYTLYQIPGQVKMVMRIEDNSSGADSKVRQYTINPIPTPWRP